MAPDSDSDPDASDATIAADLADIRHATADSPTHADVTERLIAGGWSEAGEGDWAIALRSPGGLVAARISAFDPAAAYSAALYREGADNPYLPRLYEYLPLDGGGSLQALEFLEAVESDVGERLIAARKAPASIRDDASLVEAVALIDGSIALFGAELLWPVAFDDNPENVMRARDGRVVFTDPYGPHGQDLYDAAADDPERVARAFPPERRRHMMEIPALRRHEIPTERIEQMRAGLASIDVIEVARAHVRRGFRWIGGDADTWSMLRGPASLRAIAEGLAEMLRSDAIDVVVGIEARGFVLAPLVAAHLGAGFSPVRKSGSLFPGNTIGRQTDPDYRGNTRELSIRVDHFRQGQRVALVDDWIETGRQAIATARLIADTGAELVAVSVVIDEASDATRSALPPIRALVLGQDLPEPETEG